MVTIEHYNDDGANWQAQCVLAYLRSHYEIALEETYNSDRRGYDAILQVGRYENCREQGYVFSIKVGLEQRHYAVYEHRNSDHICVLISDGVCMNTPNVEFMWKDRGENATKYDYNNDFRCGNIIECGEWIIDDMLKWVAKLPNKNNESED
jgi:hypothetical protein